MTETVGETTSQDTNVSFGFELVDLQVTASAPSPIVDHTLLRGKLFFPAVEKDGTLYDPIIAVDLSMDEFDVNANTDDYKLLVAMISENFIERTAVVDDTLPSKCLNCSGHHYSSQLCDSVWMRISAKALDASLLVRSSEPCTEIANIQFEELELVFINRTTDAFQLYAGSQSMVVTDARRDAETKDREILSPLSGNLPQVIFFEEITWAESKYP